MTRKMLIDAANEEEVRVCVIENKKVEEFDFETASRRPLRGNIFLARVTRVEPSLQAAFVEYGGNRHGFLAFSEIHPDYYQIPVSDREEIRAAEAEEAELAELLNLYPDDDEDADDTSSDVDGEMVDADGDIDELDAASDDDAAAAAVEDVDDSENERKKPRRRGRSRSRKSAKSDKADDNGTPEAEDDATARVDDADPEADPVVAAGEESDAAETSDDVGEHGDPEEPKRLDTDMLPPSSDTEEEEEEDEEERSDLPPALEVTGEKRTTKSTVALDADDPTLAGEVLSDTTPESDEGASADSAESLSADQPDTTDTAETLEPLTSSTDEDGEDNEDPDVEDLGDEGLSLDDNDDSAEDDTDTEGSRAELLERYEAARKKRAKLLRGYKIQEVIKRRQILLVQVVKEERGNKGAALTTYLSLAGRYCVLMPNTARGGGISRKIPNASDRKRLRKVVEGLGVAKGMGLIIRTAGAKRTKAEIKRDYDYLTRLWENIREQTLQSIAPAKIYEEASLIKRAIRDMYDKDIELVLVQGEDGYREAKDFMKMLMPSHAKNVQPYKDEAPIFLKHGVEQQLDAIYQPVVKLKSGGYLVINQTEALVAVDVNSGKATRERNIEQTALKTNLEAAKELARQCRLRDLAGLIVVDFIDMEEHRNNRSVEKKFKDALKSDRARIQVGRISSFGLLEMSRQRRRSGIVDGTTVVCPTCAGAGVVRSKDASSLRILRAIEAEAITGKAEVLIVGASMDAVLYILNDKRDWLSRVETTYGVKVELNVDPAKTGDQHEIEKHGVRKPDAGQVAAVQADLTEPQIDTEDPAAEESASSDDASSEETQGRKRRRRRKRGRRGDDTTTAENGLDRDEDQPVAASDNSETDQPQDADDTTVSADGEDKPKRKRRRGRRGGSRRKSADGTASENDGSSESVESPSDGPQHAADDTRHQSHPEERSSSDENDSVGSPVLADVQPVGSARPSETIAEEKRPEITEAVAENTTSDAKKKSRKGWWQRALGG
ncbi:MAG: Rne/Rng family ribonuclease [Pseudomonadota bacterium]